MNTKKVNVQMLEPQPTNGIRTIDTTSRQTIAKPLVSSSLWAFMYNSCIHESSWATISLHYSKEGAEKALAWHKEQKWQEWQRIVDTDEDKGTDVGFDVICPFGIHEDWCVEPVEVLP